MDMEGLRRIVDGPLGFSLRGATYGALLGWLYDKSKEEKEKKKVKKLMKKVNHQNMLNQRK